MVGAFRTRAALVYASRQTQDHEKHWVEGGSSSPKSNFSEEQHHRDIINLASKECELTPNLDQNGFQICRLPSAELAFEDEAAITNVYYKEIETFLLQHCTASRVVIFDHTIRRPGTNRGPIPRTHVDQTTKASIARVERHVPEIASQLLRKRFQIINVWRPVRNAAYKSPLAFCDFQSLSPGDMIATDRVVLDSEAPPGETYSVAFNDAHRWYFHKDLQPEYIALIKCFDSKAGVATYCPHTAFTDPQSDADKPERESIELRALVFYDD